MNSGPGGDAGPRPPQQAGDGEGYRIDARGARGLLVGDLGTQVNYFYRGTWTDGVAPAPLVGMSGEIDSPYRGLGAFGERDAALFFGREAAAEEVLGLMSLALEGPGLAVVSGVSGAGKSSLLRAGVLPRLRGVGLRAAPQAASWPCLVFTPGGEPLRELAVRVAPVAGADAAALLPGLASNPRGFALTARQAAVARPDGAPEEAGQRRLLVVIDQFEQLFTQCRDEDERRAFITALHAAAADGGGQQGPAALVVLAVRADFEARLADYPLLAPMVQGRYLLTAMTELQLRMAVTRPAAIAGSGVEEDLVRVLLQEARARPGLAGGPGSPVVGAGALPLLSHALDQAWRQRAGAELTLADYERAGGIGGAVAGSAQRAYGLLEPARQQIARQVFTRLTAVADDGADAAVRVTRADLTAGGDADRSRDVDGVLEAFAAERLLTLAGGTVEISHEVLLTAWPLLRDTWLAETRADRAVRARLQSTAGEWDRAGRDQSYLYSGSRLDSASQAAARISADARQPPLGQAEEDFLRASRHAGRRRRRRQQGFLAALMALVVGLCFVSAAAFRATQATAGQRDIADYQRDIAISEVLASHSQAVGGTNATVSQLESIAAWGVYPSAQAYYAMLTAAASPQTATFTDGSGQVNSVAFSPDGKTLATGDDDGGARLWNLSTGRLIWTLATGSGAVLSVAFSPDGKTLATGDQDAGVRLWNVSTGRLAVNLTANLGGVTAVSSVVFSPDGKTLATDDSGTAVVWNLRTAQPVSGLGTGSVDVDSLAFSHDGKTLATGDQDGTTHLWNLSTRRQVRTLATGSDDIWAVAFSPDGKTLATSGQNGEAQLWNLSTGRQLRTLATGSGIVWSVAFSPDGKTLATGDQDGTAQLWNLSTRRQIRTLSTGSGDVNSVAFSPDGKTLATGDDDAARVWNLSTGWKASTLSTGSFGVNSVAFSPDGKTLATGDDDGKAEMWTLSIGRQVRTLSTGSGDVWSVAFSPDGKTLATGNHDGTAWLWNLTSGQVRILAEDIGDVPSVAFSPDRKTLATGGEDGTAELWNLSTGQEVRTLWTTGSGQVNSVAFSPDGKTLATGDPEGAQLWNLSTGQPVNSLATADAPVVSVAFSPDGKTLATGGDNGIAELWNLSNGRPISTLAIGSGEVDSVAFSPDGKTLATGDPEGAQLWNLSTGQQISTLATGSGGFNSVAFSPDGKTLATGDPDGTAELWNVSYLVEVLARLCSQVGGSLTPAEWARYVPPGPRYRNVCAQDS